MAALGDEVLDGYLYPACTPHSYPYPPTAKSKGAGGGWRHRGDGYLPASSSSSSWPGAAPASFPGYGQLMAAEYFDSYQRAQLMALLSQVSPGLAPRPHRVSSRDVGVQVNPRRDASVQCSLGRRTLLRRARDAAPTEGAGGSGSASPQTAPGALDQGSPPSGALRPVRFPRTVAVYSPVAARRLTTFLEGAESAAGERGPPRRAQGLEEREAPAKKAPQRPRAEEDHEEAQAAVRASWEQPADQPGLPPREARGGEGGEGGPAPTSPEQPRSVERAEDGEETSGTGEGSSPRSPELSKERLRFQFLEQKYGYYHCKDCNIRWESAYVWCVQGTNKSCKQTRCSCPVKLRHVDPKRPHRQDLCGRCKGKRLSCDSTFSFKYII
ncbi:zygote arrest protein 1 isoform X2 [Choloepus didactylus]|uniref:zygote arrest protein 1 isoform X2 n=1 Tax=Choloepus didactylus TaxID=27675 RepID=UPI00189EDD2B|nr:zygote arrest protein 1 isoform X2 [Choloepus didactylus]